MSSSAKLQALTSGLESVLTILAKECLTSQPKDVEVFCLEVLAKRQGMRLSKIVEISRGISVDVDEAAQEFAADVDAAGLISDFDGRCTEPRQRAYHSSDESEDMIRSVGSYHSNASRFDPVIELTGSDMEDAVRVRTAVLSDINPLNDIAHSPRVCRLFSTQVLSSKELEHKAKQYQNDERMKSLFRAWDGDDSGSVDFVELVMALHKFEQVAREGIDIQVASDALLQFVESDTARELSLPEFTKVITLFALNNFHKDFDEVADHMLAVATGTSEVAVISARSGVDTSEMEAADKEEEEFLLQTVKGMEEHVTDNILKIRTKRVAFWQNMAKLDSQTAHPDATL